MKPKEKYGHDGKLVPVASSVIEQASHDGATGVARIHFKGGGVHEYEGMTRAVFQKLISHPSPGKFFNESVVGKHQGRKVDLNKD